MFVARLCWGFIRFFYLKMGREEYSSCFSSAKPILDDLSARALYLYWLLLFNTGLWNPSSLMDSAEHNSMHGKP